MSNDTTDTATGSAAEAPKKAPLAPIILAVLAGEEVSKSDFGRAAYAFVPTARENGPKLLTKEGIETARDIAGNEKADPVQREANTQVIAAHEKNLGIVVGSHKAAIITILSTPIGGAKEAHPEVTEAYKELGVLADRLLSKKAQPGLERDPKDRSQIINGVANDVYNVIKDNPEFADLKEVATNRRDAAKTRLAELNTEFEAKFPKEDLQKIRMIGLIRDYQNDPTSLSQAEKKSLVIASTGKPVFAKGKLTPDAKDRLNALQSDEKTPDWLTKQIRGVFAKDTGERQVDAVKKDVGPGL